MSRITARGKDTWTAHLPSWRRGAVGRLAVHEVYLIAVLDRDRERFIRLEIRSDHARALAVDLLEAADRADDGHQVQA
jgi:hypothetical protein